MHSHVRCVTNTWQTPLGLTLSQLLDRAHTSTAMQIHAFTYVTRDWNTYVHKQTMFVCFQHWEGFLLLSSSSCWNCLHYCGWTSEVGGCVAAKALNRAVYGSGRVLELYNGLGRVRLSSMIAQVRLGLEVYVGKPGLVTGNPHFWERKFAKVYEGWSRKCEKHLHKARFYTSNKAQLSKLMIKSVKTSIWASFLSP